MGNNSFWLDKKVLVTGHTGFKGGWLVCALSILGAKVFGFSIDKKPTPSAYDVWAKNYKISDSEHIGDITDITALQIFIDHVKPEIVIHLAAQPLVLKSYNNPLETLRTNILGTTNLLECCRSQTQLQATIIVTTDKVYKNDNQQKSFTETDELGGKDLYSSSKACCELITASYNHSYFANRVNTSSMGLCTVRAGNVIGGGDWAENRIVPDLMRALKNSEQCTIRNPNSTRPWQHVLEPLSGYLLLAEKLAVSKKYDGAWNFGPSTDHVHTVKDLVERLTTFCDGLKVSYLNTKRSSTMEEEFIAIDSTKAQKKLQWFPRLSFDKTIENTCYWYQAETDTARKNITEDQISQFWKL
jgi:CDP-glucose 4,6-dehydratase